MTGELFKDDAYLREFEAKVVHLSGREVVLDRTAFYPGGGGQPPDKGALGVGPVKASVVDVKRDGEEGVIVHVLDKAVPSSVRELFGTLDWERRLSNMRYHTALHALSGVVWRELGAKVTGERIRNDRARMDFSFPGEWTDEVVSGIETSTNEALSEGRPVLVYEVSREEAMKDSELIRTAANLVPEWVETVRVVEIEGLDTQTDGGTHVSNTREVGEIEVTSHRSKGKQNKRLEFVLR